MNLLNYGNLKKIVQEELEHLTAISVSDRPWEMPLAAALSSGLPLLISVYFNHLGEGLVSSMGGLVFLYLPNTPMHHRMTFLMACAFGVISCFTLGLVGHFFPLAMVPGLAFLAVLATMICRFYRVGPPGSLFFVMAASIGLYMPIEPAQIPFQIGLVSMGCFWATLIGFLYSAYMLRLRTPNPAPRLHHPTFGYVVFDSVVIGLCVAISLAIAQFFDLSRPYWVPVSCLAVVQGVTLRAVWNKQLHRILGTVLGILFSWALLSISMDALSLAILMMALMFVIESLVIRHYGLAVIFITPLTILLVEAAHLSDYSATLIIQARVVDTILGSLMGLVGGICIHNPVIRSALETKLKLLVPPRFIH